jgi:hypothetical protein
MGDGLHFTVRGLAPLRSKETAEYIPTVNRSFYRWDLYCRMVTTSDFINFILHMADKMPLPVIDSLNYNLNTRCGQASPNILQSSLTAAGADVSKYPTETVLTTDRPDGVGASYRHGMRGDLIYRHPQRSLDRINPRSFESNGVRIIR